MRRNINEAEWNFHFGNNHNGKPYYSDNKFQMGGRDTGHFGSGTYFSTYSSNMYDVRGEDDRRFKWVNNGNDDPRFIQIEDGVYRVDFDLYKNLYRVRSTRQGDILYSLLKRVNGFYNNIAYMGEFNPKYANYNNSTIYQKIKHNADALNLKCPSYLELIRMAQNHTGNQSFSTVFMEYNGYNGVNVSGVPYYDNTTHGSVIYDLSKVSTDMQQVKPKSLDTFDFNAAHSDMTVFDNDDYEMRAATGQESYRWSGELNDMPVNRAMRILKNSISNGNIIGSFDLLKLNDTLQKRYLSLLYTHWASHGSLNRLGHDVGYQMFYYSDYNDRERYLEAIAKNHAFYWVNYKPREYDKHGTGFTLIAEHLFWGIPYDSDRAQGRVKIMNELKAYLKRELTDYEKDFIEYNSKPDELDESLISRIVRQVLRENLKK